MTHAELVQTIKDAHAIVTEAFKNEPVLPEIRKIAFELILGELLDYEVEKDVT